MLVKLLTVNEANEKKKIEGNTDVVLERDPKDARIKRRSCRISKTKQETNQSSLDVK